MLIEAPGKKAVRLATNQRWPVWLIAIATLGSGLMNLFSVMADPLIPARREMLREFFPMEFVQLSRSLILLSGLALIVLSINIYRRKQRAYRLVLALAVLSVVFHLTKGLDYEEASGSFGLVVMLLVTRRCFPVKSRMPDLRPALLSLSTAVGAALLYAVAGFWLLEPKEFGLNFHIGDSIHRALLFLSLQGDPGIVPNTRYARWFLDSLYLTSFAVIAYAGFALFRPVLHRFHIRPHEFACAKEIAGRYGRSAQEFFKLWPDKSLFFSHSQESFLAYGVAGGCAVVLGDPVGPEEEIEPIVRDFAEMCRENGWICGFHQVLPDFLPVYRRLGFHKLKIGDDAVVDLEKLSLEGREMRYFRIAVRKLERQGIAIREYDPPIPEDVLHQAREVSNEWLRIPGRRERRFTLGSFDPAYLRTTPLVTVVDGQGRMLAFTNIIPSYRRRESTSDLMRRRTEAPNGIMDYLFIKVLLREKARGFERFNMSLAPMSGFQEHEEATPEERAVHLFFQHLNFLFSFRGLRQYKAKFATYWEPRYVIYRKALELPRVALALGKLSEFEN